MANIEIQVPDIGDFDEVTVIELMVKVGDTVKVDQSLITVESDKASMEIPSSHAGVVKEMRVALGDKVKQGSLVLILEADGAGKPAFSDARWSGQDERIGSVDPSALQQGCEERAIKTARCFVVHVLGRRHVAQAGEAQSGGETSVMA